MELLAELSVTYYRLVIFYVRLCFACLRYCNSGLGAESDLILLERWPERCLLILALRTCRQFVCWQTESGYPVLRATAVAAAHGDVRDTVDAAAVQTLQGTPPGFKQPASLRRYPYHPTQHSSTIAPLIGIGHG
eukprot:6176457-Pleurochrysis_carterae.AAC.2